MENNVIYVDFKSKKRLSGPQSESDTHLPKHLDRYKAFLERMDVGMVQTIVNGTYPGVVLPESYKQNNILLNWSYKFNVPDLKIDDQAISGTLSFQQQMVYVTIPWGAILSMYNLNKPIDSRIDWVPDA